MTASSETESLGAPQAIQEQLCKELYPGTTPATSSDAEQLLWCLQVIDATDQGEATQSDQKDQSVVSMMTGGAAALLSPISASATQLFTGNTKPKQSAQYLANDWSNPKLVRYLCLTMRKDGKLKLSKVKQQKDGHLSAVKTWKLDELKSLELVESTQFVAVLQKPYAWVCSSALDTATFLFTLCKLMKQYMQKTPRLINVTESELQDLVKAGNLTRQRSKTALEEAASENKENHENRRMTTMERTMEDIEDVLALAAQHEWTLGQSEALSRRLQHELHAVESANVHALIQSQDLMKEAVREMDIALGTLDEMETWLDEYAHALDSMGQEVKQIEMLNQALQTQNANQGQLYETVQNLLERLSISENIQKTLRMESLDTEEGRSRCTSAAAALQSVLNTPFEAGEMNMSAVQERLTLFKKWSNEFVARLYEHLKSELRKQAELCQNEKHRFSKKGSVRLLGHESVYDHLGRYRSLVYWLRDADAQRHVDLQRTYQSEMNAVYRKEMGHYMDMIRTHHLAKRDDAGFLFTDTVTSGSASLLSTFPKAGSRMNLASSKTMGGSTTTLASLKAPKSGDALLDMAQQMGAESNAPSMTVADLSNDNKITPDAALQTALGTILPLVLKERNFCLGWFHSQSAGKTIVERGEQASDDETQRRLNGMMEALFDGLIVELTTLIETGLKLDSSSALGCLVAVENCARLYQVAFLTTKLESIRQRLVAAMDKFVDEQIKAIEEIKVTSKKRSGILPFVRTFPIFIGTMEQILEGSGAETVARSLANRVYDRIAKVIFANLDQVARESETGDEKEQTNVNVINIENQHHLYTLLRGLKVPCLEPFVKQAKQQYDTHLASYCRVSMRRAMSKLLEFFEGVQDLLRTSPAEEVGFHISYNKINAKKVMMQFPGKEVKKTLELLYKRVDKHFTEEEGLLQVVWREIQNEFIQRHNQFSDLIRRCYPDSDIVLLFTINDVLEYFSEIAKSH